MKMKNDENVYWTLYSVFVGVLASIMVFSIFVLKLDNNLTKKGFTRNGTEIIRIDENFILKPFLVNYDLKIIRLNKMSIYASKKYKLEFEYILAIEQSILKYSEKYDLPPSIIYSIIERESGFNRYDRSGAECIGLMQINYHVWKKELKIPNIEYLFEIENNIKCGCYIFNKYYKITGTLDLALQRYFGICEKAPRYSKSVLDIQKKYLNEGR